MLLDRIVGISFRILVLALGVLPVSAKGEDCRYTLGCTLTFEDASLASDQWEANAVGVFHDSGKGNLTPGAGHDLPFFARIRPEDSLPIVDVATGKVLYRLAVTLETPPTFDVAPQPVFFSQIYVDRASPILFEVLGLLPRKVRADNGREADTFRIRCLSEDVPPSEFHSLS